jgi:RimJ/RimL family protein N-acetyltransferase
MISFRATLFATARFRAIELGAADVPDLQRFFEANPEYFLAVGGRGPDRSEAHEEVHGTLPEGFSFTRKWTIGFVDETGSLIGTANVVSDLLAKGVWHIGLFIVATRLHGTGMAQAVYEQLESWSHRLGARWMRLGVVEGNARAERFWERCAFTEVRKRHDIEMGARTNTVRVMARPLDGGTVREYLALVARDRPEPSP